jgi:hypothetical protein
MTSFCVRSLIAWEIVLEFDYNAADVDENSIVQLEMTALKQATRICAIN